MVRIVHLSALFIPKEMLEVSLQPPTTPLGCHSAIAKPRHAHGSSKISSPRHHKSNKGHVERKPARAEKTHKLRIFTKISYRQVEKLNP